MVSIYVVLGLYFAIGSLTCGLYRRGGGGTPNRLSIWLLYGLSRLVPVFMLTGRDGGLWLNLLFDLALFLLVYRLSGQGRGCVVYLLNPLVLLSVLTGQIWIMVVVVWIVLTVLVGGRWAEHAHPDFSVMEFYPEYLSLTYCGLFAWIAAEYYGQRLGWLLSGSGKVPAILLLAAAGGGISLVSAIRKWLGREEYRRLFSSGAVRPPQRIGLVPEGKLTRWDALLMAVLTAAFALVAYRDLGSLSVPQNSYHMQRGENHEIILDLGEAVKVERIDIYLGHQNKRTFSFSYIQPGSGEWTLHRSKQNLNNPYVWAQVSMDVTTRYLGLVSMDVSADLLEVVVLGEDGVPILPVNASEYEPLFDEQALYPGYQTYYHRMIFDELHHGRTAYDYLYGLPFSEVTHPPLGKVLISLGIRLFDMTPFGWRFISALFGSLMVPLMYLFGWMISRKTKVAAAAAVLLCTEFMHFALSRISTLDIIIAFFILLMFYLMFCFVDGLQRGYSLKYRCTVLVLCGCATGCAVATKWTGFYAAAGIAVLFFACLIPYCKRGGWSIKIRRELAILFGVCVVSFIAIPALIYVLSYMPFAKGYPNKTLLQTAIDNSVFMQTYHADAVFDHPYSSEWYTWLVNQRPLLDAWNRTGEGQVSTISTFGNPLVVWGGLAALVYQFYLWMCRGDQTAKYLTVAYLSLLMPWWFIHRTVFIYQYFGCILILILMLVHSAAQNRTYQSRSLAALMVVSCGMFVLFYPVLSGQEISASFAQRFLEWFDSWTFV